jgi:hypothetical protein
MTIKLCFPIFFIIFADESVHNLQISKKMKSKTLVTAFAWMATVLASQSVTTLYASCRPSVKTDVPTAGICSDISETKAELRQQPTQSEPARLSFQKAFQMLKPEAKTDTATIEATFASMLLQKLHAERYICDADWGGNTPAIEYCWGYGVKLENWEMVPITDDYYGLHFAFFFDETRQTGSIKQIDVITSSDDWHARFMDDALKAGFTYSEDAEIDVYQRPGKIFKLKIDDTASFYIFDFSVQGNNAVAISYDSGGDI